MHPLTGQRLGPSGLKGVHNKIFFQTQLCIFNILFKKENIVNKVQKKIRQMLKIKQIGEEAFAGARPASHLRLLQVIFQSKECRVGLLMLLSPATIAPPSPISCYHHYPANAHNGFCQEGHLARSRSRIRSGSRSRSRSRVRNKSRISTEQSASRLVGRTRVE